MSIMYVWNPFTRQLDAVRPENNGFYRIDESSGSADTYGQLAGTIDGANTTFMVSNRNYLTGTLMVYLNGQLQSQGSTQDWTETTPASGTFDFTVAPLSGDLITTSYYARTLGTLGTFILLAEDSSNLTTETGVLLEVEH